MLLTISAEFLDAVGGDALAKMTGTRPAYYGNDFQIDLRLLNGEQTEALFKAAQASAVRGTRAIVRDIIAWQQIQAGAQVKAKTGKQLCAILIEFFKARMNLPYGLWVAKVGGLWDLPYYVTRIDHRPRQKDSGEYLDLGLAAIAFDGSAGDTGHLSGSSSPGKTAETALAAMSLRPFTEAMYEDYLESQERFTGLVRAIGTQVTATGRARIAGEDHWWGRNEIRLGAEGASARLVIDVEETEDRSRGRGSMDFSWWGRQAAKPGGDENEEAAEEAGEGFKDCRPVHPILVAFDLRRHEQIHVHVDDVVRYRYNETLADKLILPAEITDLIRVLVTTDSGYRDLITGKSGGTVILCSGPPGVGKTLTAEVFAETVKKPLYTVQCAQLGTEPVGLEKQLAAVLARAERWGAICLLDEADVYVSRRGESLIQNAVVGVFLRLLERYDGVLFLTTNRGDAVDDAIASRCMARIEYECPSVDEQRRLWAVLSEAAGATIPQEEIERIVGVHTDLTGRDIKNVLKLAMAVSVASGDPLTAEVIGFVRRFKPTGERVAAVAWRPRFRARRKAEIPPPPPPPA